MFLISAEANTVKVCNDSATETECSGCERVGPVELGGWNEYGCSNTVAKYVHLSNNRPNSNFLVACEVEVIGSSV